MTELQQNSPAVDSLEALLAATGPGSGIPEGDVVQGTVTAVGADSVTINIGKAEGQAPLKEFPVVDGAPQVKAGDKVDVLVEFRDSADAPIRLSRARALELGTWDRVAAACEKDGTVEGTIVARVRGGLSVDVGVKAFLPESQATLRPSSDLDRLVGEKHAFKVIKFNRRRLNIVLSRRVLLEQQRDAQRKQTLQQLKEDAVVTGEVRTLTDYGAFVDLGGVDGLLHVTDMSWTRVGHPRELFKVGDQVKVKVLKMEPDGGRISLGYKQIQEDPWVKAAAAFQVGSTVRGKVVSIADYGAFVELAPGVEALMHVSEMSWNRRVKHPSKLLNIGDEVEAKVLAVDAGTRRISLGKKQLEANPWTQLVDKYPLGTTIRGTVRSVTDFGLFVTVEEGIDGLVHVGDLRWERVKHPGDLYKPGDEVEARVLSINPAEERMGLGIKQLTEDPWMRIQKAYPSGTRVKGKVQKITDFGAFIEIEPGTEGLCHVSEMDDARVEDPHQLVKVGQEVEVMVLDVDRKERRIALSLRALKAPEEKSDYRDYLANDKKDRGATLGDLIKEKSKS